MNIEAMPKLVDTTTMARLLGVSNSLLEKDRLRPQPKFPFVQIGRSVRYSPSEVLKSVGVEVTDAN